MGKLDMGLYAHRSSQRRVDHCGDTDRMCRDVVSVGIKREGVGGDEGRKGSGEMTAKWLDRIAVAIAIICALSVIAWSVKGWIIWQRAVETIQPAKTVPAAKSTSWELPPNYVWIKDQYGNYSWSNTVSAEWGWDVVHCTRDYVLMDAWVSYRLNQEPKDNKWELIQ